MILSKYFTVFNLSWQNEFLDRLNFLLWRLKNIFRFSMIYFLWSGIFISSENVFGYSQSQMLTYVFMVFVMGSIVLSAPSADNIGGEIGSGDLSNYLVKPLGYLKYWFARDIASKVLNLSFAVFEFTLMWFLLKPKLVFPTQPEIILGFFISTFVAICVYYLLSSLVRFIAFWTPENTWGLSFLLLVFIEVLAGGIFPLNILPNWVYLLLQVTPFPYLTYFPIAIFSGKIVDLELVRILIQSFAWLFLLLWLTKFVWKKGLMVYQASGK